MSLLKDTAKTYGFLWQKEDIVTSVQKWHYNEMQEVIDEPIVSGQIGIEIGSGCGYDTYIMAKNNPTIKFISIDISDGIYKTKQLTKNLGNVFAIKCSALALPIKDKSLDFAYSFGVLHHTTNPKNSLFEIARILKNGKRAFVYLYEDHSDNILKYSAIRLVSLIRIITTKMPYTLINILSWLVSPLIFLVFSVPSKILYKFKPTRNIAEHMPFNFGRGFFSLHGDIYDRFRAPIEYRFSKDGLHNMFIECGFLNIKIAKLRNAAGWVVWGTKP